MVSITVKGDFKFDDILDELKGKFKNDVATKVGQHSLLFFRVQYQKQGINKDGFKSWKDRKYKVNRKLLVETGAMRDSMKITSTKFERTRIEVNTPYASYHQDGTVHIPQREMLYESKTLNKQIDSIIKKELNKIFKK